MYSNTHKFIFLHTGKCAGSSIKQALMSVADIDTESHRGHTSLNEMFKCIRDSGHNHERYFKFGCVRNPWDREVSLYHHMSTVAKRWPNNPEKRKIQFDGTFEQFVNTSYETYGDYSKLDHVIRYESLQYDFDIVCDRLRIDHVKLPCVDYNTGRPSREYKSYYNTNSQQIVAEKYAKAIEYFNYKFGK